MGRTKIELKVWASTVASLVAGVVLAVLEAFTAQPALLEGLPGWARFLIITASPALVTFLAGYAAPHTTRPDLESAG